MVTWLHMYKDTLPALWRTLRKVGYSCKHCLTSARAHLPWHNVPLEPSGKPDSSFPHPHPLESHRCGRAVPPLAYLCYLSAEDPRAHSRGPASGFGCDGQLQGRRPLCLVLSAPPQSSRLKPVSFPPRRPVPSCPFYLPISSPSPPRLRLCWLSSVHPAGGLLSPPFPARPPWELVFRITQHGPSGYYNICSSPSESQGRDSVIFISGCPEWHLVTSPDRVTPLYGQIQ